MSFVDPAPLGRNPQHDLIWDMHLGGNVKQALKLCDKVIEKGDKSDYVFSLKAYMLCNSNSDNHIKEGFAAAKILMHREQPITDLNALHLLQGICVGSTELSDAVTSMWQRAIKASPEDEEIMRSWFFSSFHVHRFPDAQKAAMIMQKSFPTKRKYYFWAIIACHLVSLVPSNDQSELFGTLALRMITKAAHDVPSDPGSLLSPGRSIQTLEELNFLFDILQSRGKHAEALGFLQSPNLGIWSPLVNGDRHFIHLKLGILNEAKLELEAWNFCKEVLQKRLAYGTKQEVTSTSGPVDSGDDWVLWRSILKSQWKLDTTETWNELKQLLQDYRDKAPQMRGANLARLQFCSVSESDEILFCIPSASPGSSPMFSVCIHYFEEFSGSGNCFKDLVFYVECLPHQEKAEFHRRIQKFIDGQVIEETKTKVGMVKWVTRMAGCSKFNYVDIMSDPVDKMQKEKLAYFIKTSLETYSTCLELLRGSEFQPGADIGILSAMTLINLSKIQHRPDSKGGPVAGASRGDVARPAAATSSSQGEGAEANDKSTKDAILEFQAAAILEHILQSSKNNYQALLMLVRLYIRLGAISLGFQVYYRFNIKNVQNDSLAHCSFTRISTLQPFPTPRDEETFVSDDNLDPALGIIRVLKSYSKDDKFAQMNSLAMKRGSYHQTLEFLNFQSQKDTSICKFMWQIERRRMSRLRGKPSGGVQEFDRMELDPITTTQSDNRDDAIFPSFEPTKDPSFEESVRVGPKPYDRWTSGFHLSEILYSEYLHNGKLRNTGFGPGDDTSIGSSLMDVLLFASGDGMNKDFTEAEKAFLSLQCSLAKLMRFLKTEESATPPGLPDLLEQVEIHLKSEIASTKRYSHPTEMDAKLGFRFLTWKFFHKVYLGLEGLQSITYFLKWSANIKQNEDKPANTLKKDGIANVNSLVHELYQAIRAAATYHKGMLMETGVMASMVDHALGRDEAGLENLVGGVIEEVLGEAHMEIISTNVIESWKVALDGILKVEID